jgi:hypothetical protein
MKICVLVKLAFPLALLLDMERLLSDQALKQGHLGDALAHTGDEGRSTLR